MYRLPIFVIANGTEGATVRIDAYSTTNNDSLTYRILNGSVLPLQYDEYISVVGDQLVIASVPEELLPASIFIDVCRMCMDSVTGWKMAGACLPILCSDLSHRKLSIILIIFFFRTLHHAKSIQLRGWQKLGSLFMSECCV